MTKQKTNQKKIDQLVKRHEKDGSLPIFRSSKQVANMKIDHFVVPQAATNIILASFKLPQEQQENAVAKLVDRRPDWLDLSNEEQVDEIRAVLLLETVAWYLYSKNFIQDHCTMYENGFDKDGNVVLDAFYVTEKSTKRAIEKLGNKKQEGKAAEQNGRIIPFPKGAPANK